VTAEIRLLRGMPEMEEAARLFVAVWRPPDGQLQVVPELLQAWAHSGCFVAGVFDGGAMVGASAGFFGHHPGPSGHVVSYHSHITGLLPSAQGRGIGVAVKRQQYAWALANGVDEIVWTFDPLLARNAWFNLARLGADAVEYLPDFYGEMTDGVNAGQGSDRLYVRWPVVDGGPAEREVDVDDATPVLAVAEDGTPRAATSDAARVLVSVPPDVERMRAEQPDLARSWRAAVRATLGGLMADGGRVAGFTRAGQYLVERSTR
jgi:predicted GNAT superfamily acetyltransferase